MQECFIDERVIIEADYIIDNRATVRQCGESLGISKSTVHADMRSRLKQLDFARFAAIEEILQFNYSVRHLRGGESTKRKYTRLHAVSSDMEKSI